MSHDPRDDESAKMAPKWPKQFEERAASSCSPDGSAGASWLLRQTWGEHRAREAQKAISSPLLEETSILTLHEVAEAARIISEVVDPDANIISRYGDRPDAGRGDHGDRDRHRLRP